MMVSDQLAQRVNRLFAAAHRRDEPEQSTAAVAREISMATGRVVPAHYLDDLRSGACGPDDADPETVGALAAHFDVPGVYLLANSPQGDGIDADLCLLISARDAGVQKLAMRHGTGVLASDLGELLGQLPPPPSK